MNNEQLIQVMEDKAVELIRDGQTGVAIDLLQAIASLKIIRPLA